MFAFRMRPNKFLASGITLALSLASVAAMLALIALVQGSAPRAWGLSKPEAEETLLQNGIVRVEPSVSVVQSGEVFSAHVMIYDAINLSGFQFIIDYDPSTIEVPQQPNPMILGDFLGRTGRTVHEWENAIDATTGIITYSVFTTHITPTHPGPDGDGVLASVQLQARALGTSTLNLKDVKVTDVGGNTQNVSVGDGLVIVVSPPNPAQVSIQKSADPLTVIPRGLLTYTLQRSFALAGQHSYREIAFDPIPNGTTYLAGSATLNGLPAPGLYSATLNAIHYQHDDTFTDADQWTITFQVRGANVPSGTLIVNTVTETVSFDGGAYSGPYVSTSTVRAIACTQVSDVDLSLLTSGDIYPGDDVAFSADISPDDASKPYTYTVDYDDGTTPLTLTSSDDPLALDHTFAAAGSYDVAIAVWNCTMSAPVTDSLTVIVSEPCQDVSGVDLSLLTGGDIYPGSGVAFSADISPDDASKPYTYTIDYDDGTTPLTLTSSDDPLALNHTFVATGSYDVAIAVWNCAMSAPVTDSLTVIVSGQPCQEVSSVDLSLLTSGSIYTDTNVVFSADISPDGASKPYTYTIDYDDGTPPLTLSSSDDPLALDHTFAAAGSYDVAISVWNCAMMATEAVTDTVEMSVLSGPAPLEDFWIHLPIVAKNY